MDFVFYIDSGRLKGAIKNGLRILMLQQKLDFRQPAGAGLVFNAHLLQCYFLLPASQLSLFLS